MVLSFKEQFENPILPGLKVHSIREDSKNRWKPGRTIHFATGVRTSRYNQFKEGFCVGCQNIKIEYENPLLPPSVFVDGERIAGADLVKLAVNDGFNSLDDFFTWFDKSFEGKIIHWTEMKY